MCSDLARFAWMVLVASASSLAQIGGGSVVGSVIDPGGATIAGARVSAVQTETGVRRETRTNDNGYFEFPLLPAGKYRLEVEKEGFKRSSTAVFDLNSGTRPRFDLRMELGQVTESVEVIASAPLVNTTSTDLGVVMTNTKVESLPLNGRNFQQLVGLQAGVINNPASAAGGRNGIEFHGSTALGNNLLLDGVDMSFGEVNGSASDASAGGGGSLINTVSVEAIEEFKATGSAFSAEYGRAIGGVLNITTKSGTNQLRGSLFEFFRNDKLDANSFFSNRSGFPRPPLRWNQFGGNLGGPIVRNKAFFFFNYEGAQVRRAAQITGNVPTPALTAQLSPQLRELFTRYYAPDFEATANPLIGFHRRNDSSINDEHTYLGRFDIDLGQHRLSVRYSYNNQDFVQPTLSPIMPRDFPTRFHNAVIQDNWSIRPNILNEIRLGLNRTDLFRLERNRFTFPAWATVGGVGLNANLPGFLHFIPTTYSFVDNLSWISGKHSWKFGADIRVVRSARNQGGQPTHMYNNVADLLADRPNRIRVLFGGGKGLNTTNYGFYAQDDWRLSPRLQLNLGIRWEYSPPLRGGFNIATSNPFGPFIPTARDNMHAPDRNNWGPRAGVIWSPFGSQKLVIRSGGGISYLPQQTIYYMDMAFLDPRLPFVFDLNPAEFPSFPSSYPFPSELVNQIAANPSLLPPSFIPTRQVADYNRRDSYAGQWNFSLQSAITSTLALQASYVGSRSLKLTSPRNVNLFDPALNRRPEPQFGDVNIMENAGRLSYHALQLAANQQLSRGFTADAFYTWGKTTGYYLADDTLTFNLAPLQDPYNIAGSNGVKSGDIRHRFVGVFSYQIPAGSSWSGFLRAALGGWTMQSITGWRSGLPVNVTSGVILFPNTRIDGQRPDLVSGVDPYVRDTASLRWLNRGAFDNAIPAAQRRFGNLGYNALRGPSGFTFDGAVHKQFIVAERHRVSFRCELFNALNHKVLGNPVSVVANPNFGLIQNASGGRNIQLALKYAF